MWELPAGLLEEGEQNLDGMRRRAAIEALEETGYELSPEDFEVLDGAPFLSPGIIPERIHFARAHVSNPRSKVSPKGDGSPAEDDEGLWWVPVEEAIEIFRRGETTDAKTELGLLRIIAERS